VRVGGRLAGWTAFVLAFAALSYGSRASGGEPPPDVLYQWSSVADGLVQFAIIGLVLYAIGRGRPDLFALRRPRSWKLAAGIALGIAGMMIVLGLTLAPLLHPGQEQGLTPTGWRPSRAAAYVANGIVIAVVAPIVEELAFRGLGYSLLRRFGRWTAIALVGIAFGVAHGLVEALPFLVAFGAGLAYLRDRTDSVFPGMVVHGLFNGIQLVVAVTVGDMAASILRACAAAWSALSPF
jgi:membrane protease YdiL (CAAX protease family)